MLVKDVIENYEMSKNVIGCCPYGFYRDTLKGFSKEIGMKSASFCENVSCSTCQNKATVEMLIRDKNVLSLVWEDDD